MTKQALLTPQDIKLFIYNTIQKVHVTKNVYYGIYKLSEVTGISVYFLKQYTRQGMPYIKQLKTKRYNINKVIEWLNKNNIEFTLNMNV